MTPSCLKELGFALQKALLAKAFGDEDLLEGQRLGLK
jgi:hypothetical protein